MFLYRILSDVMTKGYDEDMSSFVMQHQIGIQQERLINKMVKSDGTYEKIRKMWPWEPGQDDCTINGLKWTIIAPITSHTQFYL